MVSVPALVVLPFLVVPFVMLFWLACTWPAELAERDLLRLGRKARATGELSNAERAERVAGSFGVCRSSQPFFDVPSLLAFASMRRRLGAAVAAPPDPFAFELARVWRRATPTLVFWSVTVAFRVALRTPALLTSPSRFAAAVNLRVATTFASHEALVDSYSEEFARLAGERTAVGR